MQLRLRLVCGLRFLPPQLPQPLLFELDALLEQLSLALESLFEGLVAQGIGIWIGFQTFINMGVNLGALPTKGLTLPLMSYGGSAIIMNVVAIAVVLRIDIESKQLMRGVRP